MWIARICSGVGVPHFSARCSLNPFLCTSSTLALHCLALSYLALHIHIGTVIYIQNYENYPTKIKSSSRPPINLHPSPRGRLGLRHQQSRSHHHEPRTELLALHRTAPRYNRASKKNMINDSDGPQRRTNTYTARPAKSPARYPNATVSNSASTDSAPKSDASVLAAAAHAAVPNWANLILMVFLILGGCCTNVS